MGGTYKAPDQASTSVASGKALFTGILPHCPLFPCGMVTPTRCGAHAKPENRPPSSGSCNSLWRKANRAFCITHSIWVRIRRSLPQWQIGVKVAWDSGVTSEDALLLAASSAHEAQTLIQANAVPGTVGNWRSSGDRELDFGIPQVTDLKRMRLPIEVKGDHATGLNGARQTIRQRFRKGLVLSRTVLDWRADIAILPVWSFLAGLREEPHRTITLG